MIKKGVLIFLLVIFMMIPLPVNGAKGDNLSNNPSTKKNTIHVTWGENDIVDMYIVDYPATLAEITEDDTYPADDTWDHAENGLPKGLHLYWDGVGTKIVGRIRQKVSKTSYRLSFNKAEAIDDEKEQEVITLYVNSKDKLEQNHEVRFLETSPSNILLDKGEIFELTDKLSNGEEPVYFIDSIQLLEDKSAFNYHVYNNNRSPVNAPDYDRAEQFYIDDVIMSNEGSFVYQNKVIEIRNGMVIAKDWGSALIWVTDQNYSIFKPIAINVRNSSVSLEQYDKTKDGGTRKAPVTSFINTENLNKTWENNTFAAAMNSTGYAKESFKVNQLYAGQEYPYLWKENTPLGNEKNELLRNRDNALYFGNYSLENEDYSVNEFTYFGKLYSNKGYVHFDRFFFVLSEPFHRTNHNPAKLLLEEGKRIDHNFNSYVQGGVGNLRFEGENIPEGLQLSSTGILSGSLQLTKQEPEEIRVRAIDQWGRTVEVNVPVEVKKQEYSIKVQKAGEGDVIISSVLGESKGYKGEEIEVTAIPRDNYKVGSVLVNGIPQNNKNFTFKMEQDTVIEVSFVEKLQLKESMDPADLKITEHIEGGMKPYIIQEHSLYTFDEIQINGNQIERIKDISQPITGLVNISDSAIDQEILSVPFYVEPNIRLKDIEVKNGNINAFYPNRSGFIDFDQYVSVDSGDTYIVKMINRESYEKGLYLSIDNENRRMNYAVTDPAVLEGTVFLEAVNTVTGTGKTFQLTFTSNDTTQVSIGEKGSQYIEGGYLDLYSHSRLDEIKAGEVVILAAKADNGKILKEWIVTEVYPDDTIVSRGMDGLYLNYRVNPLLLSVHITAVFENSEENIAVEYTAPQFNTVELNNLYYDKEISIDLYESLRKNNQSFYCQVNFSCNNLPEGLSITPEGILQGRIQDNYTGKREAILEMSYMSPTFEMIEFTGKIVFGELTALGFDFPLLDTGYFESGKIYEIPVKAGKTGTKAEPGTMLITGVEDLADISMQLKFGLGEEEDYVKFDGEKIILCLTTIKQMNKLYIDITNIRTGQTLNYTDGYCIGYIPLKDQYTLELNSSSRDFEFRLSDFIKQGTQYNLNFSEKNDQGTTGSIHEVSNKEGYGYWSITDEAVLMGSYISANGKPLTITVYVKDSVTEKYIPVHVNISTNAGTYIKFHAGEGGNMTGAEDAYYMAGSSVTAMAESSLQYNFYGFDVTYKIINGYDMRDGFTYDIVKNERILSSEASWKYHVTNKYHEIEVTSLFQKNLSLTEENRNIVLSGWEISQDLSKYVEGGTDPVYFSLKDKSDKLGITGNGKLQGNLYSDTLVTVVARDSAFSVNRIEFDLFFDVPEAVNVIIENNEEYGVIDGIYENEKYKIGDVLEFSVYANEGYRHIQTEVNGTVYESPRISDVKVNGDIFVKTSYIDSFTRRNEGDDPSNPYHLLEYVVGGTPPYRFEKIAGEEKIYLSPEFKLMIDPSLADGEYTVRIRATDSSIPTPDSIEFDVTLTVDQSSAHYHNVFLYTDVKQGGLIKFKAPIAKMVNGVNKVPDGTEVTLTAIPFEGYKFIGWSTGKTDPVIRMTITEEVSVVAKFESKDGKEKPMWGWEDVSDNNPDLSKPEQEDYEEKSNEDKNSDDSAREDKAEDPSQDGNHDGKEAVTKEIMNGIRYTAVMNYDYCGKAIKPVIFVYDGQRLLREKTDYTLSYKNNKNAYTIKEGEKNFDPKKAPAVILNMKGNYSGKKSLYFTIHPVDITKASGLFDEYAISGGKKEEIKAVFKFNGKKLTAKDYTIEAVSSNSISDQTGRYKMKIVGKGNFTGEDIFYLTIVSDEGIVPMSKVKVSNIPKMEYTGMEVIPENLKVSYKKDVPVVKEEYTIFYRRNMDAGEAEVIFKGTGKDSDQDGISYVGEKIVTFKIKGISIKKADLVGLKKSYSYTGYGLTPEFEVVVNGKLLKKDIDYTITYINNINKGTATGIITATGKNGYTGSKSFTFKIKTKDISDHWHEFFFFK